MPETQLMIEPSVPDGFPPLPAKCFELIYADPPWSYKQTGRGAAENHYRTVSVSKLATLPIAQIAADDAAIAMWATWPNLLEALELMQAWGFGYKTCLFNWIKTTNDGTRFSIGGGLAGTRANSEICLLGTRGRSVKRLSASVRQIIETQEPETLITPRSMHSRKPLEARSRLVELYGDVPRIELFARNSGDGFEAWGDQAPVEVEL